jgi:hypothetical protein
MTSQPAGDRPLPRPARSPRRVVLKAVGRRDAAQRLSLALTLLARAGGECGDVAARGAARAGAPAPPRPAYAQEH